LEIIVCGPWFRLEDFGLRASDDPTVGTGIRAGGGDFLTFGRPRGGAVPGGGLSPLPSSLPSEPEENEGSASAAAGAAVAASLLALVRLRVPVRAGGGAGAEVFAVALSLAGRRERGVSLSCSVPLSPAPLTRQSTSASSRSMLNSSRLKSSPLAPSLRNKRSACAKHRGERCNKGGSSPSAGG